MPRVPYTPPLVSVERVPRPGQHYPPPPGQPLLLIRQHDFRFRRRDFFERGAVARRCRPSTEVGQRRVPYSGDQVVAEAAVQHAVAAGADPNGPFHAEDKPMIEAQARAMGDAEFWSLKPVLLAGDAAAVRARRLLARMIEAETASLAQPVRPG